MEYSRDSEQQRVSIRLPLCYCCGERIQSDFALVADGNKYMCEDCSKFYTEDYIED